MVRAILAGAQTVPTATSWAAHFKKRTVECCEPGCCRRSKDGCLSHHCGNRLAVRVLTGMLVRAHFNNWMHGSGLAAFITYGGVETDAIGFVSLTATWFIRLIALMLGFDALGLPAVAEIFRRLSLWLPNLVVALVVLVVGGLAANALAQLARAPAIGPRSINRFAAAARVVVWGVAIVFAANQVGIASELLTTVFTALVAGFALAFGLGAHETVRDVLREVNLPMRWPDALGKKSPPPRAPEPRPPRREH